MVLEGRTKTGKNNAAFDKRSIVYQYFYKKVALKETLIDN